jgi:hypothetical protein
MGAGPLAFPALLDATEKVSAAQQRAFFQATGSQLGLLAAAAAAALIPQDFLWRLGPIATLVFFLAALAIQLGGLAAKAEGRWYDARAAAESIKTASWEFAVGGESFRLDDDAAESRFREVLKRVLANVKSLDVGAAGTDNAAATSSMKELRSKDLAVRAEAYLSWRVEDQVQWYSSKATRNKQLYKRFSIAVVFVEAAAVLLGVLRVNSSLDADFLGPLAACAAGLVGWMQAKKYSNLAEAYAVTSHEVSLVSATLSGAQSEESWAQAVHDAEAAFSREHTMWQARRQGPV